MNNEWAGGANTSNVNRCLRKPRYSPSIYCCSGPDECFALAKPKQEHKLRRGSESERAYIYIYSKRQVQLMLGWENRDTKITIHIQKARRMGN